MIVVLGLAPGIQVAAWEVASGREAHHDPERDFMAAGHYSHRPTR
jgi:hypothetical protein